MEFDALARLLEPETLAYPSGVERLPGGFLLVAVLTRMPGGRRGIPERGPVSATLDEHARRPAMKIDITYCVR